MPDRSRAGKDAKRILLWLSWADKDYVAARRLLLKSYLPQGSGLANTALEKYFKALIVFIGVKVPRTHDISALHSLLLPSFPDLKAVNCDFLLVLKNAYELRYPDALKSGFSVTLSQAKVLVELDRTVKRIRQMLKLTDGSGKPMKSGLDILIKKSDPDLVEQNCYFGKVYRGQAFADLSACYELRVVDQDSILEAEYATSVPDDGVFPLEGLWPGPRNSE